MPAGTGILDYDTFLGELARLDANTVIALSTLPDHEYPAALILSAACGSGIIFRRSCARLPLPLTAGLN